MKSLREKIMSRAESLRCTAAEAWRTQRDADCLAQVASRARIRLLEELSDATGIPASHMYISEQKCDESPVAHCIYSRLGDWRYTLCLICKRPDAV